MLRKIFGPFAKPFISFKVFILGHRQVVKATGFDPDTAGSNPAVPAK